ncbi:MAG: glycosyltransferase [Betaproteobacteria bacterium]|nr:glycosyltransferase [Betaproteobacteria bacterium]
MRGATTTRPDAALIVFARAPTPGRVKTRLVPLLGENGAARLHARLVEGTIRTALDSGFGRVVLYCSPGVGNVFFEKLQKRFKISLRAQRGRDIGDRMYCALLQELRDHPYAVLIGSDCPALRPADLRAAARALRSGADAVLAPAEDGGYPLIGLRRVSRRLFDGIPWGGPQVLARTRRRLTALHWHWRELRTLWDVDRPEDVARLLAVPRARPTSAAARRRASPSIGSLARLDGPGRTSGRRS